MANYNLPPTPVARLRSEYAAATPITNATDLATLFVPADLEALAYGNPTPSSVLAPVTTSAHHGHATPLDITTELSNAPASAVPSSVQPRQLNRLSHMIHSTRPATSHSGPHEVMPATFAYAHVTPVVVEYPRPETLLRKDYLADQGFNWVALAESYDAHWYTVYLQDGGYTTALHPAASQRPSPQATRPCRSTT